MCYLISNFISDHMIFNAISARSMPHSHGLLHLSKYADIAVFLGLRIRLIVLCVAKKKSLIDKNWSCRRGHGEIFLDTDFTDYTANEARGREITGLKNCALCGE
jgi:hypothetical protein